MTGSAKRWAYTEVAKRMKDGRIPSDAGTLEIAEISFIEGHTAGRTCTNEDLQTQLREANEIIASCKKEIADLKEIIKGKTCFYLPSEEKK